MALTKKAAVKAPKTKEEFIDKIKALGAARGELVKIEADMNKKLAPIKEQFEKDAEPLKVHVTTLEDEITAYAEKHRSELTNDGKLKTVKLSSGSISWKAKPLSVEFTRDVEEIIADIKAKRGAAFKAMIATKVSLDKNALKKAREKAEEIDGIAFVDDDETFKIEPFGSELAA